LRILKFLDQNACSLEVSTVNGNIKVNPSFSCISSKSTVETVNGNVNSDIAGYAGNFDFEASNGKVTVNAESPVTVNYSTNKNSDKEGTVTGYTSSGTLQITAVNGNIDADFN
jgi:hypothetical protein